MVGVQEDEDAAALRAAMAMSMDEAGTAEKLPPVPKLPVGPGLPLDFKGNYELFGVVTHKGQRPGQPRASRGGGGSHGCGVGGVAVVSGRSADGGHYMGWIRQKGDSWLVFDDEDVSECTTAEILNLKARHRARRGTSTVLCLLWMVDDLGFSCL